MCHIEEISGSDDLILTTKREIGNAALSMAIAYFGSNGYIVSVPLNDTQDYDLIVDKDGVIQKVQVKGTTTKGTDNSYSVNLRSISGTTRKAYKTVKDTNVDLLFCMCGDGTMYLIPICDVRNTSTINLSKHKSKFSRESAPDYSKYIVTM